MRIYRSGIRQNSFSEGRNSAPGDLQRLLQEREGNAEVAELTDRRCRTLCELFTCGCDFS